MSDKGTGAVAQPDTATIRDNPESKAEQRENSMKDPSNNKLGNKAAMPMTLPKLDRHSTLASRSNQRVRLFISHFFL